MLEVASGIMFFLQLVFHIIPCMHVHGSALCIRIYIYTPYIYTYIYILNCQTKLPLLISLGAQDFKAVQTHCYKNDSVYIYLFLFIHIIKQMYIGRTSITDPETDLLLLSLLLTLSFLSLSLSLSLSLHPCVCIHRICNQERESRRKRK